MVPTSERCVLCKWLGMMQCRYLQMCNAVAKLNDVSLTSSIYPTKRGNYTLLDSIYPDEGVPIPDDFYIPTRGSWLWDTLMGTPIIVSSRKRARCINLILEKNVFCVCLVCLLCVKQTHLASALSHQFPSFFPFPFSFVQNSSVVYGSHNTHFRT